MTEKSQFTEVEWKGLRTGVYGAGMLVSLSDRDFTDTFGEIGAMAKFLSGQQVAGSTTLVRELAAEHSNPFGLTAPPERVRSETMAALKSSVTALTAKAPDDLDAYRELVLGLAQAVAAAKGGGVAKVEASMIEEIGAALAG